MSAHDTNSPTLPVPSATPISLPTEIDPLENPKVRTVAPVEPDELLTESLSRLIPEAAEIVTPASVVVDRLKKHHR